MGFRFSVSRPPLQTGHVCSGRRGRLSMSSAVICSVDFRMDRGGGQSLAQSHCLGVGPAASSWCSCPVGLVLNWTTDSDWKIVLAESQRVGIHWHVMEYRCDVEKFAGSGLRAA